MINLAETTDFFRLEVERSKGIVHNIFLSNGQNQIITTGNKGKEESSVLSTLLNDSLYIISFNLYGQQHSKQDEKPMELCLSLPEQEAYLFSIKNQFILGIIVDAKQSRIGHKMAFDIMKFMQSQLENVAEWAENSDIY